MIDTNSIAAATQQAVQMGPVLTKWQAHWPSIVLAFGWLVRESHIWWPFLIESGGIKGVAKLLWTGKSKTQPPVVPAQPTLP